MLQFLLLLVVLAAFAVATRWLVRRGRAHVTWEDRCAACGYIVVGLPGDVCPECGADLRRPGAIRPPGVTPGLSADALVVLWTVAFGVLWWAVESTGLGRVEPVRVVEGEIHCQDPQSRAYKEFVITYRCEAYGDRPIRGEIDLTVRLNANNVTRLRIDPVTWAYRTTESLVRVDGAAGLDSRVLARWLGGYGVSVSDASVIAELDEVEGALRGSAVGEYRYPHAFRGGSGSMSNTVRATRPVQVARWALPLTWLVVAVWLWRRARGTALYLRAMGARF